MTGWTIGGRAHHKSSARKVTHPALGNFTSEFLMDSGLRPWIEPPFFWSLLYSIDARVAQELSEWGWFSLLLLCVARNQRRILKSRLK